MKYKKLTGSSSGHHISATLRIQMIRSGECGMIIWHHEEQMLSKHHCLEKNILHTYHLITNKQLLCWACKNVLLYEKCDILMTWSYFPLLHVIHFNIRSVGCDLTALSHKHGDIREFDIYFNIRIWWMLWDLWPITAGQCLLTYS